MSRNESPAHAGSDLARLATRVGPETAIALLAERKPKWHRGLMLGMVAYSVASEAYRWVKARRERDDQAEFPYYIIVPEKDALFRYVQRWLLDQLETEESRGVVASSDRDYNSSTDEWDWNVVFTIDGDKRRTLTVDGHEITVSLGHRPPPAAGGPGLLGVDEEMASSSRPMNKFADRQIAFLSHTEEGRNAVERLLKELLITNTGSATSEPVFLAVGRWGDWQDVGSSVNRRKLESVVLRDGISEKLVADLEKFLDQESAYIEWGVPWHRGYLLYGPPGTGKTSICAALSTHFNLDIYYLTLSHIESDSALNGLMSKISDRSILVIEDIDVLRAARDRSNQPDGDAKGVTLAGLINALDGLVTPHGLITIMTTNNADALDPALVRSGRADIKLEIDYLDDDQLGRICQQYLGERPELPSVDGLQLTAADALGELKKCIDDHEAGIVGLRKMIEDRSLQILESVVS